MSWSREAKPVQVDGLRYRSLNEACNVLQLRRQTIIKRLHRGLSIAEAFALGRQFRADYDAVKRCHFCGDLYKRSYQDSASDWARRKYCRWSCARRGQTVPVPDDVRSLVIQAKGTRRSLTAAAARLGVSRTVVRAVLDDREIMPSTIEKIRRKHENQGNERAA